MRCEVLGVSALPTVSIFLTSPDLTAHSDLQPHQHLEDQNHLLLPQLAPEVGLRGPQPEQSEVVFLNVSSVKPVKPAEAVLPPLIPPPVSSLLPSLLPEGLYQPGPLGPLDYDDFDNALALDDGKLTLYFPLNHLLSFLSLFVFVFTFS